MQVRFMYRICDCRASTLLGIPQQQVLLAVLSNAWYSCRSPHATRLIEDRFCSLPARVIDVNRMISQTKIEHVSAPHEKSDYMIGLPTWDHMPTTEPEVRSAESQFILLERAPISGVAW